MPTRIVFPRDLLRSSLFLSLLALLAACRSGAILGGPSEKETARARRMTTLVETYARDLDWTIQRAADQIAAQSEDLQVGYNAVNWKLRAIPLAYEMNHRANKTEAFVGLWILTEMMHGYFTEGEGRDFFGDRQPIAVDATTALRKEVRDLAQAVVQPDKVDDAIADVERFVHGTKGYENAGTAFREFTSSNSSALSWIPSIDLTAFNPFSGLNESASAIRFFTERTDAAIQDISRQLPWKLEALAYDIEQRRSTRQALEGWNRISASTERIAGRASSLPDDLQEILTTTLDQIDEKQEGLRQTIGEANTAIVNANDAVTNANDTLTTAVKVTDGLNATAAHLTEAGAAWEATFRTLGLVPPAERPVEPPAGSVAEPGEEEPESKPFDIDDYKETAIALQATAVELRGLVEEVNTIASGSGQGTALGNVETTLDTTLASATERSRELVDYVATRALLLLGAALLAGLLYRVIASRLLPRGRIGA